MLIYHFWLESVWFKSKMKRIVLPNAFLVTFLKKNIHFTVTKPI